MGQARTLKDKELKQVLNYVQYHRHALRNRVMLLCTHWAGMRVGEVAALKRGDVVNPDGTIFSEIRLAADQTKGRNPRTVYVPEKLRKELATYIASRPNASQELPLFYTQKRFGFDANTLTQHFFHLYRRTGLLGASSHSGRRSFLTTLAAQGVGVRVLQNLAGHRSIATTQRYVDVNDEMLRKAVELV